MTNLGIVNTTPFDGPQTQMRPRSQKERQPGKFPENSVGQGYGTASNLQTQPTFFEEATNTDERDDVALPLSLCAVVPLGTIVSADGFEQPYYHAIPDYCYDPIRRLEHCCEALYPKEVQMRGTVVPPSSSAHPVGTRRVKSSHKKSSKPNALVSKSLKRKENCTTLDPRDGDDGDAVYASADSDSENSCAPDAGPDAEPLYTFYIGDFESFKHFLEVCFYDLSLRIVRRIVTEWVKHREPRRRNLYGPYSNKLPKDTPPGHTPTWWPCHVPYYEPVHLARDDVVDLAVDFILVHRDGDQSKRTEFWIQNLHRQASCAIDTIPSEYFSASKSKPYNSESKNRAVTLIIPNLFEVAESYHRHVCENQLYDELDHVDPGTGRHHAWHEVLKPIRKSLRGPRGTKRKTVQVSKVQDDAKIANVNAKIDDKTNNTSLARGKRRKLTGPQGALPSSPTVLHKPVQVMSSSHLEPSDPISSPRSLSHHETEHLGVSQNELNSSPRTSLDQSIDCLRSVPNEHHSFSNTPLYQSVRYERFYEEMEHNTNGGSEAPIHNMQADLTTVTMPFPADFTGYINQALQPQHDTMVPANNFLSFPTSAVAYAGDQYHFQTMRNFSTNFEYSASGPSVTPNDFEFP